MVMENRLRCARHRRSLCVDGRVSPELCAKPNWFHTRCGYRHCGRPARPECRAALSPNKKRIDMKRPLVAVALLYGAGVVLGQFLEAPLLRLFVITFISATAALVITRLRPLLLP